MSAVTVERIDGVPNVRVDDDVDAANAAIVQDQLAEALGADGHSLIVDLSSARYVDSAGWDMLLRLSDRLRRRRAELLLVVPPASPLSRLVAIVGLPQAVQVHPTLAAAQSQVARPARAEARITPPAGGAGEALADG